MANEKKEEAVKAPVEKVDTAAKKDTVAPAAAPATVAKKPAAKKPAAKKPAAKKPAEKKAAPATKKAPAKKTAAAKKPAAKKPAAKKPAAKKAAKKIVLPKKFELQLAGNDVSYDSIVKKVNKAVKENIKSLEIYINIDEQKVYYVVNKDITGDVSLF